jgi:phosphoglycolate phosphatase
MIDAVIFDLDGTLLNTLTDIRTVVNSVLRSNGMPEKSIDEVQYAVGSGVEELARKVIHSGRRTDSAVAALSDQIKTTFLEHESVRTEPYPGIPELLKSLQKMRVPMAVLTNKPQESADKAIEKYFSRIPFVSVNGVRPGCHIKPSREAVLPVIERLGSHPDTTMMVGDSDVDMITASNAGMLAVGVSWGFREVSLLRDHGADHIVDHPMEILEIIRGRA